jgi:hypothetical protein
VFDREPFLFLWSVPGLEIGFISSDPGRGPRDVATGGAQATRSEPERNPWVENNQQSPAPVGQWNRSERVILERPPLRPCRGDIGEGMSFHGLRPAEDSLAPPVATSRRPVGAKKSIGVHIQAGCRGCCPEQPRPSTHSIHYRHPPGIPEPRNPRSHPDRVPPCRLHAGPNPN